MNKYNFTILIEKDEDGIYVGSVPVVPFHGEDLGRGFDLLYTKGKIILDT